MENESLQVSIKAIHQMSHRSYGSPRICQELKTKGVFVSQRRVARLMRASGLRALAAKRYVVTTNSKHRYPVAPNILNREFSVERKHQVWVSDITYVWTSRGWMYLTVIIDLFDRKVVGWSMSGNMTAQQTSIRAWRMAIKNYPVTKSLIFHSDRGIQFACPEFTRILDSNPLITRSMSRKGNCWDNAVAESFFKSLKIEWVYTKKYESQAEAELSVFEWIETWYNRKRRHSALGYKTISEFEEMMNNQKIAA